VAQESRPDSKRIAAEATVIDSFSDRVHCEDLLARTDNLRIVLSQHPTARSAIVINPERDTSGLRPGIIPVLIRNALTRDDFDLSRISIFLGETRAKNQIKFWLVPFGSALPATLGQIWSEGRVIDLSKPVLIGSEDDSGVCPTFSPREFADLINKNKGVAGRVVVRAERNQNAASLGKPWIDLQKAAKADLRKAKQDNWT
jgi:hypothetical protein